MKKIFTCISIAVVSLFATTPVMAQQQISEQDKATIVKAVVPAMIDQVSQISGIDFKGLQNPDVDLILNSPLFGTQSTLRSGTLPSISIQPDSVILNLSKVDLGEDLSFMQSALSSVKLTFADYEELVVTATSGRTVNVNLPLKTTATVKFLGLSFNINLNLALGEKTGLLPFGSFSANLDLGSLESILGSLDKELKSGELFSIKETGANAVYTYDIAIGDILSGLMEAEEQPNFKVIVDMTSVKSEKPVIDVVLKTITDKATLTTDEASIYLNTKALASNKMVTDSIIAIAYEFENNVVAKEYSKSVQETKAVDSKTVEVLTTIYEKEAEDAEWKWNDAEKYIIEGNQEIDPENLVSSVLNSVIEDLKNLTSNSKESLTVKCLSFSKEADVAGNNGKNELTLTVTPAIVDMQTIKATVELVSVDDDEAEAEAEEKMLIEVTLPLQSETITVTFIPEGEESALATLYVKSNAMGIVTSNETIKNNVQDLKVIPLESSLYVTNGKGNYVIVNMLGQVIATGIITSDTQYVNMPNVPKGIYMISIKDKTKRTTVKFVR